MPIDLPSNADIDAAINLIDVIRARLVVKYGAAFTGLSISDQVLVIERVISLLLGK